MVTDDSKVKLSDYIESNLIQCDFIKNVLFKNLII